MDSVEREIYHYVKSQRPRVVPAGDISRHAGGKRRFRYNPYWARPVLLRMVERGILETDAEGSYHLKPIPPKDTRGKRWASAEMAAILKASGKEFDNVITVEDEDDYYYKL